MSRITEILSSFENWELAYFYKYKYDTYLDSTKEKIYNYIFKERGLTKSQIQDLIKQQETTVFDDYEDRCPNCKSNKLSTDQVEWNIPLFEAGSEDEYATLYELHTGKRYLKDKITCNVCGYAVTDPNNRSLKKKTFGLFFDSPLWTYLRSIVKNE